MAKIDKLYLDVLNLYLFNMSYLSVRTGEKKNRVEFYFDDDIEESFLMFAYVVNRGCLLTKCNELLNDINPNEISKLEKLIDNSIRFQQIHWNSQTAEKRRTYRNGIAHGRFFLDKTTDYIHIDNKDFVADLPFYEFSSLSRLYYAAYMKTKENYLDYCLSNLKEVDTVKSSQNSLLVAGIKKVKMLAESEYNRNHYLDYVDHKANQIKEKVKTLKNNYTPKAAILTEDRDLSHEFNCQELPEGIQVELFNYIKYIADWDKIEKKTKYQYFRNFINQQIGNNDLSIEYEELNSLVMPLLELSRELGYSDNQKRKIGNFFNVLSSRIGWQYSVGYKVYGYVINVMNAMFLCFAYLSERYKDECPALFKDYDLSDFKPDESIPISGLTNYQQIISSRKNKIQELSLKQQNSQTRIKNFKASMKIDALKREQVIFQERQKKIETFKLEMENAQYYSLDVRNDETAFLTKIRNSLTHGFYSIDYNSGFAAKDVRKTIITFEDIDTHNGDKVTLRVSITARELVSLLKQFREKLAEILEVELINKEIIYGANSIRIKDK